MKSYIQCRSPGGATSSLGAAMANATHLLIAGASGYGKSVAVRCLIDNILKSRCPCGTSVDGSARFMFIDPKQIDLCFYARNLPPEWVAGYADNASDAVHLLRRACSHMDTVYRDVKAAAVNAPTFRADVTPLYIIIEEYADLTVDRQDRAVIEPLVRRLLQLGRAANIHVVIVTQRPTADVIGGSLKVNIDYRLALHTVNKQDSRNILQQNGAECLQIGQGLFYTPAGVQLVNIPFITPDMIAQTVAYWNSPGAITRTIIPDTRPVQRKKTVLRSLFGKLA